MRINIIDLELRIKELDKKLDTYCYNSDDLKELTVLEERLKEMKENEKN